MLEVERDFDACIKIALSVEVALKESVWFKASSVGVTFVKHNKPKNIPDSAEKYQSKRHNKLSDVVMAIMEADSGVAISVMNVDN